MKRASICPEIWSLTTVKQWVYYRLFTYYDFSQHAQPSLNRVQESAAVNQSRAEQRITELAQKKRIARGMTQSAQLESARIMAKYVLLFKKWLVVVDLGPGRAKIIMIRHWRQREFRKTQSTYCLLKRLWHFVYIVCTFFSRNFWLNA